MRFTVIIPTFNRPVSLDRCLTAIADLDYPKSDFEVLVVDDGSDPPLSHIIARHAQGLPLRYYRSRRQGPARARNLGLRHALGEYVVFTDDDCRPSAGWLRAFDRVFAQHPGAGLGGAIVSAGDESFFGRASQMLITFLYDRSNLHHHSSASAPRFFCSNNVAFPGRKLLEIGGFDETFPLAAAEDRDVCARWHRAGELCFVPDAIVLHCQNLNARSFWAQHYRYGRGAYQFWLRRQDRGESGVRVASSQFYWEMLRFPFASEPIPRAASISVLLAVSQVACAAGYFAERFSRRKLALTTNTESSPR